MSTLSQIRTNVQAAWPTNYHSTFLTDTKTDEYINNVVRWICKGTLIIPGYRIINHSFKWQKREVEVDTVDAQQRYTLPEASSSIWRYKEDIHCELVNSDSYRVPLKRMLKRDIEIDSAFRDTAVSGTPSIYVVDHGYIWFYPIPDHDQNSGSAWTINFEYYGYPPDLSGDSDTNELTNYYPEILEYGATELGFRYGQDYEQANYWKGLKDNMFIEMLREDQKSVLSNIDTGLQPMGGSNLGERKPGSSGEYYNETPYS